MKKRKIFRVFLSCYFVASALLNMSPAVAAVTENECVNGGGYVTEGSGCKFCVGGKLDLEQIKGSGKKTVVRPGSETKSTDKNPDKPDQK